MFSGSDAGKASIQGALLRQLEYYFSDTSLPFDNFLLGESDEAGAIKAAVLAAFPRIVSLTPDFSAAQREGALIEVAGQSDSIAAVGADRLKRVHPLPKDDAKAPRSAMLQGFPRGGVGEEEVRAAATASTKLNQALGPAPHRPHTTNTRSSSTSTSASSPAPRMHLTSRVIAGLLSTDSR